jgi:hypothetical protein
MYTKPHKETVSTHHSNIGFVKCNTSIDTTEIVLHCLDETCSDRTFGFLHSLCSIIKQSKFELGWPHRLMCVTLLNLSYVPYHFYSSLLTVGT